MNLSLSHLKRYKQIAFLLWKYGRGDLAQKMDQGEAGDPARPGQPAADVTPDQLADDLEAMGPTYIKLGQVLAGRPDLLPAPFRKALERLQDRVKPFDGAEAKRIVAQELDARLSKAFSRFDHTPIAAASLGQVHAAALRDGREVVVKVQRPGIRGQIAEDFEVLEQIAEFMEAHTKMGRRYHFKNVLEEFRLTIQQELNYEREAQNLITLGENLKEFELIQVPQPVLDYCTRSVLTMDQIEGCKITSLSPLAQIDLKNVPLAEELFRAYLKQVLVDGVFHADPHPGNIFVTNAGKIALLDLGMTGHVSPHMQENLLKMLLAISENKSEETADLVIHISQTREDFNPEEFHRRISQVMALRQDQALKQINVGRSLLEVSRNAAENGLTVPSNLTLLGKTLLQLDEIGKILDPAFDPNASIRRNLSTLMAQRLKKNTTPGNIFGVVLELKDFLTHLPSRVNRVMDAISNSELEVKVKSVDAKLVMEGFQKIANRITTGIVLASLILGAALLMQVRTTFSLFGYPGLAMVCFLAAAAGGFWLVISIFVQDRKNRNKLSR